MKRFSLILLTILMVAACKMEVEYCNVQHPHRGQVKFSFNWASEYTHRPKYMDVLAERVVNHTNPSYLFETTTFASGNDSTRILETPDSIDSLQYVNPADKNHHILHLRAGEYNFLAYNGHREGISMNGDTITEAVTNELDSLGPEYAGWRDRNPYSGYMVTADTMHLFSAKGHLDIPLDVVSDALYPLYIVPLTPQPLTQVVNINFTMKPKESGIVVEDITCCMSGVCNSMRISTREVFYRNQTYKVLYKPRFSQDPKYASSYSVQGKIRVPGILPSPSYTSITGPGVLQVNIHIRYTDSNNKVHHRILEGSINLRKTIETTPSLHLDEETGYAKQTKSEITLNIDNIMGLTYDKIESEADVNIDKWIDHTSIGIDF